MSRDLFSRYIWLIDTIKRYGALTREQINQLWIRSSFSNGEPMPRRTFYAYRNAIEELFKVNIECNPSTFEYFTSPRRRAPRECDELAAQLSVDRQSAE